MEILAIFQDITMALKLDLNIMDNSFNTIDLVYMMVVILYTFLGSSLVSALVKYYESILFLAIN